MIKVGVFFIPVNPVKIHIRHYITLFTPQKEMLLNHTILLIDEELNLGLDG